MWPHARCGGGGVHKLHQEQNEARERLVKGGERKDQIVEDNQYRGSFCKYCPAWHHVACHVSVGSSRGAFGISDEPLNKV